MQDVIKINQEDNVAVALRPIAKGETLDIAGTPVTTLEEIPQGHKVAIKPIAQGGNVIKYGFRIGIAKEDLPRIFEKAFTGFNGHVDHKATGIGLYLSKQILDRLGHRIKITSQVGKGTCVHMSKKIGN